jgi:hypothetical protein
MIKQNDNFISLTKIYVGERVTGTVFMYFSLKINEYNYSIYEKEL